MSELPSAIKFIFPNGNKIDDVAVDQVFPGIFEIHGYPCAIDRLHLANTPVRLRWMPPQCAGCEIVKQLPNFPFTEINLQEITISLIPCRFV